MGGGVHAHTIRAFGFSFLVQLEGHVIRELEGGGAHAGLLQGEGRQGVAPQHALQHTASVKHDCHSTTWRSHPRSHPESALKAKILLRGFSNGPVRI